MGFLARKIRDDRGVVREVYGTGFGVAPATDPSVLARDVFRRVRRLAANGRGRRLGRYLAVSPDVYLMIMASAVGGYAIPRAWFASAWWSTKEVIVGILLSHGTVLVIIAWINLNRRGFRWWRTELVVRGLLVERRCPACGYDMGTGSPEADGCVVCPECGGAWKLPRRPCRCCGHDLSPAGENDEGFLHCPECGIECEGRL